jgi:uncharacterized protein YbjT (DUF2867 family)
VPERPILVTGPSGNVGREVVRAAVERGLRVRAGVRDPGRAAAPDGVEHVRLDLEDPSTYAAAVAGTAGLFLLRPTHIARPGPTLNRLVDAAAAAGARHCVVQSIEGADRQRWLPHRRIEQHVEASGMGWTFLRANHFMQNLTGPYLPAIRRGALRLPAGAGRISFVDCADLGDVAATAFADPPVHTGRAYPLTGPQALSFDEVAAFISDVAQRPVRYEEIGRLAYIRELRRDGTPWPGVVVLEALHLTVRRGVAEGVDPTLATVLGRPPRTLEDFAARHARDFR